MQEQDVLWCALLDVSVTSPYFSACSVIDRAELRLKYQLFVRLLRFLVWKTYINLWLKITNINELINEDCCFAHGSHECVSSQDVTVTKRSLVTCHASALLSRFRKRHGWMLRLLRHGCSAADLDDQFRLLNASENLLIFTVNPSFHAIP